MLVSLLPFVNSMERLRCVSSPKVCLDFFSQFDKLVARIFVLVSVLLFDFHMKYGFLVHL